MNREILFRGKRVDNDEWVYGYFIKYTHGYCIYDINSDDDDFRTVYTNTIGQYTNLKDKNGDMIFEGDIIHESYLDKPCTVKFDEDRGGWFPFACGDGCGCCESEVVPACDCEIIGNEIDGITKEIEDKPKRKFAPLPDVKEYISYKVYKQRIEGIPLEGEDGNN